MPRALSVTLPKEWKKSFRLGVLHTISLVRFALVNVRGWAAKHASEIVLRKAEGDRLQVEMAVLREQMKIKDARMGRVPPAERPHYKATERMAILEMRAARGWSMRQTAREFLLTDLTIASWMKDLAGDGRLVDLPTPVNKFPDFVRYIVQRLKVLCPSLGKVKIAQVLCRAGLHLAPASVGRILKEKPTPKPDEPETTSTKRRVTADEPNKLWHVDLTAVPTSLGFWTPWFPGAIAQCWPWCWWVAVVLDHASRRVLGTAVFDDKPTSESVRAFLGRTIRAVGRAPKYLVCDRGTQFDCDGFRAWAKKNSIKLRYGALGKHGSIAVIERFNLTLKTEGLRAVMIPQRMKDFQDLLAAFSRWYNAFRPHMTLGGCTPNEIYFRRKKANEQPRHEPRKKWPRRSTCAAPHVKKLRRRRGAPFELRVTHVKDHKHLPIVTLVAA